MGLFTEISAALSFNFGDSSKLPQEYYDHIQELDRTPEEKKLLNFLENKFGILYKTYEYIINTIDKYTNDYTNIPYNKIFEETGIPYDDLKTTADAILEYEDILDEEESKDEENIDYIVNNPNNPPIIDR